MQKNYGWKLYTQGRRIRKARQAHGLTMNWKPSTVWTLDYIKCSKILSARSTAEQCTEVHFASFLSGGFTAVAVINPPEKKLVKCTSVQWCTNCWASRTCTRLSEIFEQFNIRFASNFSNIKNTWFEHIQTLNFRIRFASLWTSNILNISNIFGTLS